MTGIRFKVLKKWCLDILKGLEYLHTQKPHPIVHRDLKCDNLFINSHKGTIMIGDLGFAGIVDQNITGSVLGTPGYLAPEVLDEKYDSLVDIYSLGMCILEISTRQPPFYECKNNPYHIIQKVKLVQTGKKRRKAVKFAKS